MTSSRKTSGSYDKLSASALFDVLKAYAQYESDKVEQQVNDGGPRPESYPFTLPGLYHWLDVIDPTNLTDTVGTDA